MDGIKKALKETEEICDMKLKSKENEIKTLKSEFDKERNTRSEEIGDLRNQISSH